MSVVWNPAIGPVLSIAGRRMRERHPTHAVGSLVLRLVDGLMESGYSVHLAHPAALVHYQGLKYSADEHDARWLAHLLRRGILHEGYIYPHEARAVGDLMRRRMQLVQTRSAQVICMQTQFTRSTAKSPSSNALKRIAR